jgi:bacterioferritin (cytochrome b1)
MSHLEDADSQVKLSKHFAEETEHAWLWTKRIVDLGGKPTRVADGYQTRIGLRVIPRTLIDILALTVVVEERSYQRYTEHAAWPGVDSQTRKVLQQVSKDEKWHISWMRAKLEELAAETEAGVAKMNEALGATTRSTNRCMASYKRNASSLGTRRRCGPGLARNWGARSWLVTGRHFDG